MSRLDDVQNRRLFAHDLRNSIGAIRTAAEVLQRRHGTEGSNAKLFAIILDELDRLEKMVDTDIAARLS
ncbi:MAG: histidine kinase dimerization/phospho-acceptor domain-containing protein [Candidatus Binatia bacterium]